MMAARRKTHSEDEPEQEIPPITTSGLVEPPAASSLATGDIAEYELPDGSTYLLTAEEAKQRGAKAVQQPANKAITPRNK